MQFEVIIPLIAYLVVVFGLSLYAMRKRASGSFLNEYFLGSRSMGGFVLYDANRHLYQRQLIYRRTRRRL